MIGGGGVCDPQYGTYVNIRLTLLRLGYCDLHHGKL